MELFLQGIEQSQWLKHGKAVLEASIFIAEVRIICFKYSKSVEDVS